MNIVIENNGTVTIDGVDYIRKHQKPPVLIDPELSTPISWNDEKFVANPTQEMINRAIELGRVPVTKDRADIASFTKGLSLWFDNYSKYFGAGDTVNDRKPNLWFVDGEFTEVEPAKLYSDWRLPTRAELLTLVDDKTHNPACYIKDSKPSYYWSATPYSNNTDYAWYVEFSYGDSYYSSKYYSYYVRCVRDGDDGLEWSKGSNEKMSHADAFKYASALIALVHYTA